MAALNRCACVYVCARVCMCVIDVHVPDVCDPILALTWVQLGAVRRTLDYPGVD